MSPFAAFISPQRRPREDDDSDFDVSVDGEGSPRSSESKRPRLGERDSNDGEASESEEGDLLPDSFRRSPTSKASLPLGRPSNARSKSGTPQKHQPGSIVRVKLTDFVTYTRAEFHPGPNLNMIIGPNGTGKSTLVCAICLGLGWQTSNLGRAKEVGEYVKHGSRRAEIEIELAADPSRHRENPVVSTKITKEGNKSEYTIGGKKSNRKRVLDLARSFSIQVDNLCQFLPQDRVVELAALSPVDLLSQTQRAAAPEHVSQWHEQLKTLRKDQKQQQTEQQNVMETLKAMQDRQRLQEADVTRLRERAGLKEKIAALETLRPFPAYKEATRKYNEAKAARKNAEREFRGLERRVEPNLRAVNEKQEYFERVDKVVTHRGKLAERSEETVDAIDKKIKDVDEKINGCQSEVDAEKDSVKSTRQSLPRLNQEIARIKKTMETPPEDFDAAEMNAQIREKTRLAREVEDRLRDIKARIESLDAQTAQKEQVIKNKEKEKASLRSQAGQQANKLKRASLDAAKAWEWIQGHESAFRSRVYGPPIVECTLRDPKYAAAVESMIPDGDKMSFTVTSQADLKILLDQVSRMGLHDINIRVSLQPISAYLSTMPAEQLQQLGLDGWLLDLIDGPEAVLAMLCDNRSIHQMAYATREITEDQFNALKRSPVGSWVTPTQSYQITRRREYGDAAVSTRVQALKQPRFFTDAPVDGQVEQEIERSIYETEDEINELNQNKDELNTEGQSLSKERKELDQESKAIAEDKARKQRALSEFNGLSVRLEKAQRKLTQAHEAIAGYRERVGAIVDRGDNLNLEKGQHALDYANAVDSLRRLHLESLEAEIIQIEARSDLQQLQSQHADEMRLLEERRAQVAQLTTESSRLLEAGRKLQVELQNIGARFTDLERELYQLMSGAQVDEDGVEFTDINLIWTPDRLESEIQSTQARLEMTHGGGNESTIQEFEKRAKDIEQRRGKLATLDLALDDLAQKITDIRNQWEPELDELVGKISEAFKENFEKIHCAGEVAVHKDDEFEQWAIQIRVKFRENEQLSILDSHRQSGGERAVSTIFYLMALQSLARAPFRVVDEINQGMDPRNERLVHSRMVDIACADAEDGRPGSQYFLITPKLLSGLKYHSNMKIHCIASGEYMPADHRELDFAILAEKALAVRAGRAPGLVSAAG